MIARGMGRMRAAAVRPARRCPACNVPKSGEAGRLLIGWGVVGCGAVYFNRLEDLSFYGGFEKFAARDVFEFGLGQFTLARCSGVDCVGLDHDLLHQASVDHPSLVRGPHWLNTTAAIVNRTTVQPKSDIS
jgi:hypothetical protein